MRQKLEPAAWLAIAAGACVIGYPFLQAEHPPMTDLPFHAAQISVFCHYADPAFHFREQFVIDPLGAPYIAMYAIGAALAFLVPVATATKAAAVAMLALVPLGLCMLFRGMKKSPLLGVLGLAFVWTDLAHWGFLSFIGAVGLHAMCVGIALLLLSAPSPRLQVALGAALVATLFTHVYRFPFALASVLLAGGVMTTSFRALRPLLAPVLVGLVAFAAWLVARPAELAGGIPLALPDLSRVAGIPELVIGSFHGQAGQTERQIALFLLAVVIGLAVVNARLGTQERGHHVRWRRRSVLLAALLVLLHVGAYLTLPERAGAWWYIYQREAFTMALFALALIPDFPRLNAVRIGGVAAVSIAAGAMALFVAKQWRAFHDATADFRELSRTVPSAPKLIYLVYDHGGVANKHSPFLHLPAWIQAEKGGWLGFHFAGWGIFPVRYRKGPNANAPPPVPPGWEWAPQHFRVHQHGAWFDTFLVRHTRVDPSVLFAEDPSIALVERRGDWWLYQRR